MISPQIWRCIHPFFRNYAPVSTPSSYCIGYSVIKDTVSSYLTKYTMCSVTISLHRRSWNCTRHWEWRQCCSVFQVVVTKILFAHITKRNGLGTTYMWDRGLPDCFPRYYCCMFAVCLRPVDHLSFSCHWCLADKMLEYVHCSIKVCNSTWYTFKTRIVITH